MIKIFLWKRDDGYFSGEPNSARDQENRWRYYIASYTSVDNTSGIDRTQTTQTILFRNLHAMGADPKAEGFPPLGHSPRETAENAENSDATANGTSDKILTRFLAAKTSESLEMRIGVTNYLTRFDPPTAESFFMDLNEREGGEVAVKDAGETAMERADLVKDKVVLINEGMKGLSREQVGERNEEFGRLTAIGIDDDDEEMDVGQ